MKSQTVIAPATPAADAGKTRHQYSHTPES
jgi:hypothetical protein